MDNLFQINAIDNKIDNFNQLISKLNLPYDLVAVNKFYDTAVIYDRENQSLHYVNALDYRRIRKDYSSPGTGGSFGPNYHLIDQRFSRYESVELTNKKRQYTTCPKSQLEQYIADGWFPEKEA